MNPEETLDLIFKQLSWWVSKNAYKPKTTKINYKRRFTPAQIRWIRCTKFTSEELAQGYKVKLGTIEAIKKGKTYQDCYMKRGKYKKRKPKID